MLTDVFGVEPARGLQVTSDPVHGPVVVKSATGHRQQVRLAHEADALEVARHPGVVDLLDFSPSDDGVTLTTAWVASSTLATFTPPDLDTVAGVMAALALTVEELHGLGVVHRRLRNDHVIVGPGGRPVLCSFGDALTPIARPPELDVHDPEPVPADDVSDLGHLLRELAGPTELEAIPERRRLWWSRASRAEEAHRRALLTLADHATHDRPRCRPTAGSLATGILEAVPTAKLPEAPPALPAAGPATIRSPAEPVAERIGITPVPTPEPDPGAEPELKDDWAPVLPLPVARAEPVEPPASAEPPASEDHLIPGRPQRPDPDEAATPPQPPTPPAQRRALHARPRSARTPRRLKVAVAAAVVVVLLVAGLIHRLLTHAAEPSPTAPVASAPGGPTTAPTEPIPGPVGSAPAPTATPLPPPPATTPCSVVAIPGSVPADVDGDGCPDPAQVEDATVVAAGHRYVMGEPGDSVVLGDWDCDGQATPALLRRSTGQVFLFPAWATPERDLTVSARARADPFSTLRTEPSGDGGCDELVVEQPGQPPLVLGERGAR